MSDTSFGDFKIRELTEDDATWTTAREVMSVELEAYVARFGEGLRAGLQEAISADPQNEAHVVLTRQQIAAAQSKNWCWLAAVSTEPGDVRIYGFVVCIVQPGGVFLAEIHTHPMAQRRGLARLMLRQALQTLRNDGRATLSSLIWLNVVRPTVGMTHPASWYDKLGFMGAAWDVWKVGSVEFPRQHMHSTVGEVLANLD